MDRKRALDTWQRAKDEAEELRARADELDETASRIDHLFGRLFELMPDDALPTTEAGSASSTNEILDGAEMILMDRKRPMLTGAILAALEDIGVVVGGVSPSSNLSAKLSQDKGRFQNHGRGIGWGLLDWGEPEDEPEESDKATESSPGADPQIDEDIPF